MKRWLTHEIARIHGIPVRRWHLHTLLLVAAAFLVGAALGFFAGYSYPYRTLPRPPLPAGQTAPPQDSCSHVMGGCLPRPKTKAIRNAADISATTQGPDLSNNDPIFSAAAWTQIGSHNAFAIFKVTEGVGYVDRTAPAMAAQARAHGLVVGGYDFLHVCGDNPAAEASLFVAQLHADGLTGPRTLPPTGDAEYGGSGCDARAWIGTWAATVRAQTGRQPMIYTGAWWWQPHLGAYWPNPSLAWVSGYGVRFPFMPSGRSQLDVWQFTDHGWNGATTSDLSIWRDGVPAFRAASLTQPNPKPKAKRDPYRVFPAHAFQIGRQHLSEHATVTAWDKTRCSNPPRRPACRRLHASLVLERDRVWFIAHHTRDLKHPVTKPRWGVSHLGARFQGLNRRTRH